MIRAMAALAAMAMAAPALASNQVYDFSNMLNEPHPFADTQYPYVGFTGAGAPVAPPPPTYGYSPPPQTTAQAVRPASRQVGAEDSLFGDSFDAIFRRVYLAGAAGLHSPDEVDGESEPAPGLPTSVEYEDGLVASAAIGRYLGDSFRLEFEASWRAADGDKATVGGVGVPGSGELTITAFMANVYYDVRFDWPLVPYIGAGLGAAVLESDDVADAFGNVFRGKDSTEFAWQGILGLAWEFGPRFAVTAEYRYLGTGDDDVTSQSFLGGLRLNL